MENQLIMIHGCHIDHRLMSGCMEHITVIMTFSYTKIYCLFDYTCEFLYNTVYIWFKIENILGLIKKGIQGWNIKLKQ